MSEETPNQRKWYQKKRYMIPTALIGLSFVFGGGTDSATTTTSNTLNYTETTNSSVVDTKTKPLPSPEEIRASLEVEKKTEVQPASSPSLSNDNYYTNVDGESVHSPAYTSDNSIPAGASARCRDGTYSFSKNRRGTCSHHGGVSTWY